MKRPLYRPRKITVTSGFTLIETLLALVLFTLILAMGYQTIVSASKARNLVVERVDRQHALRTTHRTLGHAISSNGRLSGSRNHLKIDLGTAASGWLTGNQSITFIIDSQGQLLASLDEQEQSEILLDSLQEAEFHYLDERIRHAAWNKTDLPRQVELSWLENGERNQWQFLAQP